MPYGILKADTLTYYTATGDVSIAISGLAISGSPLISGVSGIFTTSVSGATVTGNAGQFTTITGGTAQFTNITGVSGTFTSRISGATVTGTSGQFTTLTATTGVFTSVSGGTVSGDAGLFNTISGNQGVFNSSLSVPSGTAASPSISFNGDPNTGIYSSGADQVAISTGGSGRLFVNSDGNISVGATTNDAVGSTSTLTIDRSAGNGQLSLAANGTVRGRIFADNSTSELRIGNPTANALMLFTNNTERLRITSAGLVGVGTSSPATLLDLSTTTSAKLNLTYPGFGIATLASDSTGALLLQADEANTQANSLIQFKVDGTERARIDSSGRLGVGTTSPSSALHVSGSGTVIQQVQSTGGATELRLIANTQTNASYNNIYSGDGTNWNWRIGGSDGTTDTLTFATGGFERLRIDSSGRVGIGTSSVTGNLHVKGDDGINIGRADGGNQWRLIPTNGGTGSSNLRLYEGVSNTEVLNITTGGRVGIGTTSPAFGVGDGLEVARSGVSTIRVSSNTQGVELRSDAGTGTLETRGAFPLLFGIQGTERARIDSSGRLLVGTSSNTLSNARVVIRGNPAASGVDGTIQLSRDSLPSASTSGIGAIYFTDNSSKLGASIEGIADGSWTSGSNHRSRLVFSTTADGASSPTERARITSSGKTVINSTDPVLSATFSVLSQTGVNTCALRSDASTSAAILNIWGNETSGDQIFSRFATDLNAPRGSITYNRGGGVVAYNTTSDYRSKTILGDLENAGATIDAFKVYRGVMNGATVERPMLIAHEAQEVAPYCVTGEKDAVDDDGNPIYQQMDHQVLVPLLIAEIQQLRARVAALEAA